MRTQSQRYDDGAYVNSITVMKGKSNKTRRNKALERGVMKRMEASQ